MPLLHDVRGLFRRRRPVAVDLSGTQAERLAEALHSVGSPTAEPAPEAPSPPTSAPSAADIVPDLVRKVGGHLDEQAARHERLLQLLEQLPQVLDALPETVRRNASVHEDLHQHLVHLSTREDALREVVDRMHTTAAHQTDVLGLVQTNLETKNQTLVQVNESLGELHRALAAVADTNRGTAEALVTLADAGAERESQLTESLVKVQRWSIIVAACCGAALVGAVVVVAVALSR